MKNRTVSRGTIVVWCHIIVLPEVKICDSINCNSGAYKCYLAEQVENGKVENITA